MKRGDILNAPKVSIIIPCYNSMEYIYASLHSVCSQTLRGIEVILIDDGSTDDTPAIISKFAQTDPRIVFLQTNINQGEGKARNIGLEIAKGEYVAFLDSDDLYCGDGALGKLYAAAIEAGSDICGGNILLFDRNDTNNPYEQNDVFPKFTKATWMTFRDYRGIGGYTRFIFCRDFLLRNRIAFPECRRGEDQIFFVSAMCNAGSFFCIPDSVYMYRKRHKQIAWTFDRYLGVLSSFKVLLNMLREFGCIEHYRDCVLGLNSISKEMLRYSNLQFLQRKRLLHEIINLQTDVIAIADVTQGLYSLSTFRAYKIFFVGCLKRISWTIMNLLHLSSSLEC